MFLIFIKMELYGRFNKFILLHFKLFNIYTYVHITIIHSFSHLHSISRENAKIYLFSCPYLLVFFPVFFYQQYCYTYFRMFAGTCVEGPSGCVGPSRTRLAESLDIQFFTCTWSSCFLKSVTISTPTSRGYLKRNNPIF